MVAQIQESHELLTDGERRLFGRLSVFAGGWTRDAAEAICAGDLGIDVSDGLESLVDKSLVRREIQDGDEIRFDMLETIREYATERLEAAGESTTARRMHARFFQHFAKVGRAQPDRP